MSTKHGKVIGISGTSAELWVQRLIFSCKLWLLWSQFLPPTSECFFSVSEAGDTQMELITCSATCCWRESLTRVRKVTLTFTHCLPSPVTTTASASVTANTVSASGFAYRDCTTYFPTKAKLSKQICLLHVLDSQTFQQN